MSDPNIHQIAAELQSLRRDYDLMQNQITPLLRIVNEGQIKQAEIKVLLEGHIRVTEDRYQAEKKRDLWNKTQMVLVILTSITVGAGVITGVFT